MIHSRLRQHLQEAEGLRLSAYQDSEGYWTIGYGYLIDARRGGKIPQHVADLLLQISMDNAIEEVQKAFPWYWALTQARKDAIAEMAFNLGIPRLRTFKKMLAAFQKGEYERAAAEALDSKWATQVGNRAKRIAHQIRTGTYGDYRNSAGV